MRSTIRFDLEVSAEYLQNHLIETASHSTGSVLIFDTGEYSILPWERQKNETDDSSSSDSDVSSKNGQPALAEPEKLQVAFKQVVSMVVLCTLCQSNRNGPSERYVYDFTAQDCLTTTLYPSASHNIMIAPSNQRGPLENADEKHQDSQALQ